MIDFLVGMASGSLTVLMLVVLERRFRKLSVDRFTATLEAAPGKSKLRLIRNGVPVADVMLMEITHSFSAGTTAEFSDYYRYMEARRIPRG